MMNQLIADIYEHTVEMERALEQRDFDKFEALLEKRGLMMAKVESLRLNEEHFSYSDELKAKIKDTFELDQMLIPQIKELKTEAGGKLTQIKKNKQVSKSYMPYRQQNYGAFIDTNK
jgi:hypothetical protein